MEIKRIIGGMLEANGYIITAGGSECYIIDPGYTPRKYLDYLEKEKLTLLGIILTHHHSDHVGAAAAIRKELDCPVMIHRNDSDRYNKGADVILEHNDVLELPGKDGSKSAEKLVVLHTPGHTEGSICLMSSKSRVCFTGDTIFNVDLGRTDLEDGSQAKMEDSIRNIVNGWSNEIKIYPGHGDPATMKTVRKINRELLEITG